MLRTISKGVVCTLLVAGIAGCGSSGDSQSKAKSYPQDGYMGITSVNPNQPLNPTYHHYQDDANLMKAVLSHVPGVVDSRFTISGPKVNATIQVDPGLSKEQAEQVRAAAQMALDTNMPRYKVNVSLD